MKNKKILAMGVAGLFMLWSAHAIYASEVFLDTTYSFTAAPMDPQEFKTNGYYGSGFILPSIQPVATVKDITRTVPQWVDTEIILENLFSGFEEMYRNHLLSARAYLGWASTSSMMTITQLGNKEIPQENISLSEKGEGIIMIDKNLEEWKYLINLKVCNEWDGYFQMPNMVWFDAIPDEYIIAD